MKFQPFQKIAESASSYSVQMSTKDNAALFSRANKWAATEKIHGANFSVYFTPATKEIKFAKRTGFLSEDEYFYGWEELRDSLTNQAILMAEYIESLFPQTSKARMEAQTSGAERIPQDDVVSQGASAASSAPSLQQHSSLSALSKTICSILPFTVGTDGRCCDRRTSYTIIMYGELCGGFYPATSSPQALWEGPVKGGRINAKMQCVLPLEERAVQEGIYYSPQLCFALFDVAIVWPVGGDFASSSDDGHLMAFFGVDDVLAAAKHVGAPTPLPLTRGSFEEVSNFPYENFDSVFGVESLGLPSLLKGTNRAEGIVLRPESPCVLYIPSSSAASASSSNPEQKVLCGGVPAPFPSLPTTRCLVKLKSSQFAEISSEYAAPAPTPLMRLRTLVNANRVASVLSKHGGRVTRETLPDVTKFMEEDVLEDFYTRFPETAAQAYGSEWEKAQLQLSELCRQSLTQAMRAASSRE